MHDETDRIHMIVDIDTQMLSSDWDDEQQIWFAIIYIIFEFFNIYQN